MLAFGMLLPVYYVAHSMLGMYLSYESFFPGHFAHNSLKVILFRKVFRMSASFDKYSDSEINNIVVNDTNALFTLTHFFPRLIQIPLQLVISALLIFYAVGWSGLTILCIMGLRALVQYSAGRTEGVIQKKLREKQEERSLAISESFNNIKTIKLFGWETNFLERADNVYQEQLLVEDELLLRQKVYNFAETLLESSMSIAVFSVYMWLGNTLTVSKLVMTELMMETIRQSSRDLSNMVTHLMALSKIMERMWELYTAPEVQRGLVLKTDPAQGGKADAALTIRGTFSHGVTQKMDPAEKTKIQQKLKKEDDERRTKDMGRLRKAIHDYWPSQLSEDPKVPLPDRTLDQVISLSDLNISIRKGSFTVIVGATGSGKSTLLSAMLGQLLYIPEKVIKEVGDRTRPIKEGEQRYLEESILSTDLTDGSPIQYSGTTGFCEQ